MTRFLSVAMAAMTAKPSDDKLIEAAAIIDDELCHIYDIAPDEYEVMIGRLQAVLA